MKFVIGTKVGMTQIFDEKGRVVPLTLLEPRDKDGAAVFQEGDSVKISGLSKGKGFQGVVKRWGFSGRGASHGVKHEHRTLGSAGPSYPQRVIKGRKMPGRTGNVRVTVKNLKIVKIDKENNLIAVKGAVPGTRGTLLEVRVANLNSKAEVWQSQTRREMRAKPSASFKNQNAKG